MAIKFEITMTNKWLYSLMAFGILMSLGIGVWAYNSGATPNVMGHSGEELEVIISGAPMTLQQAIDGGNLDDNHTADEIEVTVGGIPMTMTLQQAIDGGNLGGGSGAVVLFDDNGDNETSYTAGFGPVNGLDNLTVTPPGSGYVITVIAQVGFQDTSAVWLNCNTRLLENGNTVATGVYAWGSDGWKSVGNEITMVFANTNPALDVPLTYAVQVDEVSVFASAGCRTAIADPDTSLMVRMERLI